MMNSLFTGASSDLVDEYKRCTKRPLGIAMTSFVDEIRWNGWTYIRLWGFGTGQHELRTEHKNFLAHWVRTELRIGNQHKLIGMASRLRYHGSDERSEERNTQLSLRRAYAVEDRINREILQQMNEINPRALTAPSFRALVYGTGTSMADVEGTPPDDAHHRAVLILPMEMDHGEAIRVTPIFEVAAHRRFWIKYVYSGSIDLPIPGEPGVYVGGVAIRDPNGCYQLYLLGGASIGQGVPVSWGEGEGPRDGWVEFRTNAPEYVNSFSGIADIIEVGAEIGNAGGDYMRISFGYFKGARNVPGVPVPVMKDLPTGGGFSISSDAIRALMMPAGPIQRDGRWPAL